MRVIDDEGNIFKSLGEMCDFYKIKQCTYTAHKKCLNDDFDAGKLTYEQYEKKLRELPKELQMRKLMRNKRGIGNASKPITIDGISYASHKSACEALHISVTTLRSMIYNEKTIDVNCSSELYEKFKHYAKKNGISMQKLLRTAMESYIKSEETKELKC